MSDEGINEEVSREVVSNQEVDEVDRGIVDTTIGRLIQSTIAPFTTTKRPGPMATDVTTTPLKMLRLSEGDINDANRHRYRMDHGQRGDFIIINNKTFDASTRQNTRNGTEYDRDNLVKDFTRLGFKVTVYNDQTTAQMLKIMIEAAKNDYSDSDCFGVAVLSHGDESVLFGKDGIIPVENFVKPIKGCKTLEGKPKIFIFQACRGEGLDEGREVADSAAPSNSNSQHRRIVLEADYLYAYSTVSGYYSFRKPGSGSWYVQALHKMLEKYASSMDFLSILTRVNREVAYEYESVADNPKYDKKKQMPTVFTMFTKDLYFTKT